MEKEKEQGRQIINNNLEMGDVLQGMITSFALDGIVIQEPDAYRLLQKVMLQLEEKVVVE